MTSAARPLRVTFCAYDKPDSVGGPVSWILRLLPSLQAHGIEPRCLVFLHTGDTGPALAGLRAAGVACTAVLCQYSTQERIRWTLEQLRADPPDVFVPNLVVAAYYAARWVRASGIPTVGVLHSDDEFYRGIQSEFVAGTPEFRVSGVVTVSREIERQVADAHVSDVLLRRIPYGVPIAGTTVERVPGRLRLAYAGRLTEEQKRISDVTRALCRATCEVPGTIATLFGDGPDRDAVVRILEGEGRGLPVSLGGRIAPLDMQSTLREYDVITLLSDYEGLPIALLEAMACGCVPVCLRVRSGISELIDDGVNGLLVNDRDESFVAAVRRLRHEPGLLARLSAASQASVATRFSEVESVAAWAKLLHDLTSCAGPRRDLRIPRRLRLPPVNQALASADARESVPTLPVRLYRRARKSAGRAKRRFSGQPVE